MRPPTAINGDYGQKTGDAKTAASTSKSAGNNPAVLGVQEDTNTVNADPSSVIAQQR